tara:strand:- start:2041 stop:4764 length:2724 start_codon:yes stop_codon:yes gene_type:complete
MAKNKPSITIQFDAQGDKALIAAIKKLDAATRKLNGSLNGVKGANQQVAKGQDLVNQRVSSNTKLVNANSTAYTKLQAVIAKYRNKMLLAAFAVGIMQKALVDVVKESARFEDLERNFRQVIGTIGGGAESFKLLDDALDGTVDAMEIFKQANTAVILGVVKSDKEMAQLFDTAQRLGQAMGVDTAKSMESMIVGMGRQSQLRLDDLGITLDAAEAYRNYANANNIAAESLTDFQKKLAFNAEVVRKSGDALEITGKEVLSTMQHMDRLDNSALKLRRSFGEALTPAAIALSQAMVFLSDTLTPKVIKDFIKSIRNAAIAVGIVAGGFLLLAKVASVWLASLFTTITVVGVLKGALTALFAVMAAHPLMALATVVSALSFAYYTFSDAVEGASHVSDVYGRQINTQNSDNAKWLEITTKSTQALHAKIALQKAENTLTGLDLEIAKLSINTGRKLNDLTNSEIILLTELIKQQEIKSKQDKEKADQEKLIKDVTSAYTSTIDGQIESMRKQIVEAKLLEDANGDIGKGIEALEAKILKLQKTQKTDKDREAKKEIELQHNKDIADIMMETIKTGNIETKQIKEQLSIADRQAIIALEELKVQDLKSKGIITEAEETQKLFELKQKDLALDKEKLKATERLRDGIFGMISAMNVMGADSMQGFTNTFKDTYAEVLAETNSTTEAATGAWQQVGMEAAAMAIGMIGQYVEAEMQLAQKQGAQRLSILKESRRYDKMSARQKEKAEKQITDSTNKQVLKQFQIKKQMSIASVMMDTAGAIMSIWKDFPKADFGATAAIYTALMGALGAAQISTINSQQPPKMAKGGLIGGRLHSQGGTMIEAERGEFVMSRRAVETAGLESMNRINSGMGSGGSINITFSGNVNSDEFIESEAIPKIKEAIRRGADIGEV